MSFEQYMKEDRFGRLLSRSTNQAGLCTLLVLAWMAASDDEVDDRESTLLHELGSAWGHGEEVDAVIGIARAPSDVALALAFNALRHLETEMRVPFLELAMTLALADGRLTPGESHILRLIADVLGVSPETLNATFHGFTGSDMPAPADLGSRQWWKNRSQGGSGHSSGGRHTGSGRTSGSDPDIARLKALAVLGLDEDAGSSEIRAAYRRMAQVHHPDRFASLGEEAVKAAEASFRRIREAHDFLMKA